MVHGIRGIGSCVALLALGACSGAPEVPVQLQGTVTAVGYGLPVTGADVIVEWPAGLGGGSVTVKTDAQGHYVAGRSVRTKALDCKGVVITVRASGYASVYNQSDEECSKGILSEDFKLIPIPR